MTGSPRRAGRPASNGSWRSAGGDASLEVSELRDLALALGHGQPVFMAKQLDPLLKGPPIWGVRHVGEHALGLAPLSKDSFHRASPNHGSLLRVTSRLDGAAQAGTHPGVATRVQVGPRCPNFAPEVNENPGGYLRLISPSSNSASKLDGTI